ncbi:MAG: hypothetical protein HYZ28_13860 [Myxococcales bacterium]|nr:hypothetical protein [Myxococcales bacterium]
MPAPRSTVLPLSLVSNANCAGARPPTGEELRREIRARVDALLEFTTTEAASEAIAFKAFETALIPRVFELGRLFIALFLCLGAERERLPQGDLEVAGQKFRRRPPQPRNLNTFFGVVRYWRTYLLGPATAGGRRGFHPLDVKLGLTADRLSMNLLSLATRLATKLSYAQARVVLGWFFLQAPSTEVIEQAVLGLGRRTAEWFESAPPPEGDGEVLIALFDSKASPTATEQELRRRRGKRRKSRARSPRHRGRERRGYYGSKPRRKKGDKSKNGRAATMVVMYTLKRSGRYLLGPINRRFYASFAPKRHAFEIARREANKRGFTVGSGKLIQIVTDGDDDLALYAKEYFPGAIHTLDVMHALEYLWTAGECLYREGGKELAAWMDQQKKRLYEGGIERILAELKRRLDAIPLTGPGNKGKRERLTGAIEYLGKRVHQMNYGDLFAGDLEIGSGAVEGAIKNIIGARFDKGGMRWIRERAEALLQLRCIEMNGDWERFIDRVHDQTRRTQQRGCRLRLQEATPAPLPKLAEAA